MDYNSGSVEVLKLQKIMVQLLILQNNLDYGQIDQLKLEEILIIVRLVLLEPYHLLDYSVSLEHLQINSSVVLMLWKDLLDSIKVRVQPMTLDSCLIGEVFLTSSSDSEAPREEILLELDHYSRSVIRLRRKFIIIQLNLLGLLSLHKTLVQLPQLLEL